MSGMLGHNFKARNSKLLSKSSFEMSWGEIWGRSSRETVRYFRGSCSFCFNRTLGLMQRKRHLASSPNHYLSCWKLQVSGPNQAKPYIYEFGLYHFCFVTWAPQTAQGNKDWFWARLSWRHAQPSQSCLGSLQGSRVIPVKGKSEFYQPTSLQHLYHTVKGLDFAQKRWYSRDKARWPWGLKVH